MEAVSEYRELLEDLDSIEVEIEMYEEFLAEIDHVYDECGPGCTQRLKVGKEVDPDHLKDIYEEKDFQDETVEEIVERELIQSRSIRELRTHVKTILEEKRDQREKMPAEDEVKQGIAFSRHPKKDPESVPEIGYV